MHGFPVGPSSTVHNCTNIGVCPAVNRAGQHADASNDNGPFQKVSPHALVTCGNPRYRKEPHQRLPHPSQLTELAEDDKDSPSYRQVRIFFQMPSPDADYSQFYDEISEQVLSRLTIK
jgi:hypothetical protein